MNKLLNKNLKPFLMFALLVLAASIPAYHYLVDGIWLKELDEHNTIIAMRTEHELNKMQLDERKLEQSIALWNSIQPGTSLSRFPSNKNFTDSTYVAFRQNPYLKRVEIDRFRGLKKLIQINGTTFLLTVETNVEETEETVMAISLVTLIFFMILVLGFILINRRISKTLWRPFRIALSNLQEFNLNHQKPLEFPKTTILEFHELNLALVKLTDHTIAVYKGQKEFTENASHELQTPISVIKGKLDLLLQNEPLTQRQYQIIEDVDQSISRISRVNKNLLTLAKIENHQYDLNEKMNLAEVLTKVVSEMTVFVPSNTSPDLTRVKYEVFVSGNKTLIEILIGNLLSNAFRYSILDVPIEISLTNAQFTIRNPGDAALDDRRLFKRFSGSTEHGSGLGLSIVKEICNKMNWQIEYLYDEGFHCFKIKF